MTGRAPARQVGPEPPVVGPPWLRDILADFSEAWCLLRHAPTAPADDQDVDILVAAGAMPALAGRLRDAEFVPLVRPGRGTHRVFVRYDAGTDSWPKVDAVTEIAFGPHQELSTDLAASVLERRQQWAPGVSTPVPGDAFWLLLFHALLDRRSVVARHRERLVVLVGDATPSDPPAGLLTDAAIPGMDPASVLALVREHRWRELEVAAPAMLGALRRRRWPSSLARLRNRLLRRAGRHGVWPLGRGLSVAVVAPRGVETAELLAEMARRLPVDAQVAPAGRWAARLRGRIGTRAGRIILIDASRDEGASATADVLLWLDLSRSAIDPRPAAASGARRTVVVDGSGAPDELRGRATAAAWSAYATRRLG